MLAYHGRKGEPKGFKELDFARLLDAAHQQLGGPIVLVWDNLTARKDALMRSLIATRPWLTVFYLPTYAPELNPVETVWSHLKRSGVRRARRGQLLPPGSGRIREPVRNGPVGDRRGACLLQNPQAVQLADRLDDPGQHQLAVHLVPARGPGQSPAPARHGPAHRAGSPSATR